MAGWWGPWAAPHPAGVNLTEEIQDLPRLGNRPQGSRSLQNIHTNTSTLRVWVRRLAGLLASMQLVTKPNENTKTSAESPYNSPLGLWNVVRGDHKKVVGPVFPPWTPSNRQGFAIRDPNRDNCTRSCEKLGPLQNRKTHPKIHQKYRKSYFFEYF